MAIPKIKAPGQIIPINTEYPTHEDIYGKGGYVVVDNLINIDFDHRKVGMLAYVDGTIYKCTNVGTATTNATWEELKLGGFNTGTMATSSKVGQVPVATLTLTPTSGDYSTLFALHSSHDQDVWGIFFAQFYYTTSGWQTSNSNIRWEIKSTSPAVPTNLISAYYTTTNGVTTITLYYNVSQDIAKYIYGLSTTQLSNVTSFTKVQDLKWKMLVNQNVVTPSGTKLATSTLSTLANSISGNAATATTADSAYKIQEINAANDKANTSDTSNNRYNPNLLDPKQFVQLHNYTATSAWKNGPNGMQYGSVLQLGCGQTSLVGQLAFDINNSTKSTKDLWFRTGYPGFTSSTVTNQEQAWNLSSWKRIAWADELSGYVPLKSQTESGAIGDVNKILTSGFWRMSAKSGTTAGTYTSNLPGYGAWGQLIVSGIADTKLQIYGDYQYNNLYFRSGSTATTSDLSTVSWKKVATDDQLAGQTPNRAQELAEKTDLNNVTTPGIYCCSLNDNAKKFTNCPTDQAFSLRVYKDSNSGVTQILTVFKGGNSATHIRGYYSDAWTAWTQIAFGKDYVKKSGDTMSGNLNITNSSSNPALGVGSSTITYNKTTGCLEITA